MTVFRGAKERAVYVTRVMQSIIRCLSVVLFITMMGSCKDEQPVSKRTLRVLLKCSVCNQESYEEYNYDGRLDSKSPQGCSCKGPLLYRGVELWTGAP